MAQRIVIANNDTNLRFEYVEGDDTIAVTEKGSMIPIALIVTDTDSKLTDINTKVFHYLYSAKETVDA